MTKNLPMPAAAATMPTRAQDSHDGRLAECLSTVARLRAALVESLGQNRRFAAEAAAARAALAWAQAELAATRAAAADARRQALHDGLTSLPNRRFFSERLDQVMTRAESGRAPLAVLYLDLDRFKPINDAYGHEAGDELLRIVAARLSRAVRAEDMVSRLGGDEFACLIPNGLDRRGLCRMATKLFHAVSAPVAIAGLEVSVRPSIGIALCPADGATADEILMNADAAMYHAKRNRTGYAFYDRRIGRPRGRSSVFDGVQTRTNRGGSVNHHADRLMSQ
jgi:diguanylate cyclase